MLGRCLGWCGFRIDLLDVGRRGRHRGRDLLVTDRDDVPETIGPLLQAEDRLLHEASEVLASLSLAHWQIVVELTQREGRSPQPATDHKGSGRMFVSVELALLVQ